MHVTGAKLQTSSDLAPVSAGKRLLQALPHHRGQIVYDALLQVSGKPAEVRSPSARHGMCTIDDCICLTSLQSPLCSRGRVLHLD